MSGNVKISEKARAVAAERAAENGYASADEYIEALLLDDVELDELARQPWFIEKIEEGLASGDAGEATKARIDQLVREGIELAKQDK
jgi:hypothetical protein